MGSRPRLLSQQSLNVSRATLQWARIGSVAGAASDTTYTDAAGVTWRVVQWTANAASGLVIATPGLADLLVVGGGSGYINVLGNGGDLDDQPGGGGGVLSGFRILAAGTHSVVVGAGGSASGYPWATIGGASSLGPLASGASRLYGMGYGGLNEPVTSVISGASVAYAAGGSIRPSSSGRGDGGASSGQGGTAGIVVVRVPA